MILPSCPVTAQTFLSSGPCAPRLDTHAPTETPYPHHHHQPPTGGNGVLMATGSISPGGLDSPSRGSGIFFFGRWPINLFPSARPFSSSLPFSCLFLETPFPLFPRCPGDKNPNSLLQLYTTICQYLLSCKHSPQKGPTTTSHIFTY